jgi:F0F1-type ATP synthase epsilon subunit
LQVLTPAETLLRVERAQWVHMRLADGAGISIYPGHAPLLAETVAAWLRYADASGEHGFDARAGILQVADDHVTLFTSGAWQPAERSVPSTVTKEGRFDRLARELAARLESADVDILGSSRE